MSELDDLLPEFLAEALDILDKVNRDLDGLSASANKPEVIDAIYRGIHTIKGSSSMFNFMNTKEAAHKLESFLSGFRNSPDPVCDADTARIRKEVQQIETLLKAKDQLPTQKDEAREKSAFEPAQASDDFIRVPVKRLNETLNAVSEIFLIRNQLVYLMERFRAQIRGEESQYQRDFVQSWEILDSAMRRGIGELERSAMSMRMMTVQGLFSRMSRVVQSYTAECGKKIHFRTAGENTELDKKVLDALGEPLVHLVRNAMDHGIEDTEKRRAHGKDELGTITLSAQLLGNEVVIRISDDGKGIDPQRILESAKKKGIDISKVTSDATAIDLIFLPGFSTADAISDISGRGVGMDAVRTSILALGGRIAIDTKIGEGTVFTIALPVSMSLVPATLININGLKYALPNHEIAETRQIKVQSIQQNAGRNYISFRDSLIPCVDLRDTLQSGRSDWEEKIREAWIVVLKFEKKYIAVRVSDLEKNTEIVVKPTPTLAPKIPFVSGVSVLPTGEPVFVLSVSRLLEDRREMEILHDAA